MIEVDGELILEELKRNKIDRSKITLYISKNSYDVFKKVCKDHDVSASLAMEILMDQFVDSVQKKSNKKSRKKTKKKY